MVNLTVKKVYCPKCQKLRRVKEQRAGTKLQFNCIKCSTTVWQKEGFNWRYSKVD